MSTNNNNSNNELENDLFDLMHDLLKDLPDDQKHLITKQVNELKNSMQQNLIAPLLTVIEKEEEKDIKK